MDNKVKLLNKFGKIYINFVRDIVLRDMLEIIRGNYKHASISLEKLIEGLPNDHKNILEELVSETIDKSLHYTLFMLEEYEEEMRLVMKDDNGVEYQLTEISDGLCGEIYSEEGWIAKYSKYPSWQLGEKIEPKDENQ